MTTTPRDQDFAYDDVPYDTEANAEAHPSAMATLGRLVGLTPRMPSAARVLEIGCGNGENLLAAATYLPDARFVGFDLASSAIAAGNAAALASSIGNVKLFTADIRDVRRRGRALAFAGVEGLLEGHERFDYVIAHGMYSWVPEAIREDLLAVMHDSLDKGGLGFLSINALPGWELRRALRELAIDAVSGLCNPEEKVARAMRLIGELGRADEKKDAQQHAAGA